MTSPVCSNAGRRRAWRGRAILVLLAAMLAGLVPQAVRAFEPFVVKDIRVEGVQRTEAGTVFFRYRERWLNASIPGAERPIQAVVDCAKRQRDTSSTNTIGSANTPST